MAPTLVEGSLVQDTASQTGAQLLRIGTAGKYEAMSFDGKRLELGADGMKPFSADMLPEGIDLIIGPMSDETLIQSEMIDSLLHKGYCSTLRLIPSTEVSDMLEAARSLTYSRVPADFEPYYLGRDSREKTVLVDFEDPDLPPAVNKSPLLQQDLFMSELCESLAPSFQELLGITCSNRTNLLLRQTFENDDEEADFPNPELPSTGEQERFMGLMKRKRVCMMQFLGPETGTLTLIPKDDGPEVDIVAIPGTMVIFLTEIFRYSHLCESGAALTLQCWFLAKAPEFNLQDIGGDLEVLAKTQTGPAGPSGETVAVTGTGIGLAAESKDNLSMWAVVNKGGADGFVQFPFTRFDRDLYVDHADMQRAMVSGKIYTNHQGYVGNIEYFDASFFGISQGEARAMDPNQRKCLETVYLCIHDGGLNLKHLKTTSEHVGCFVGVSGSEWGMVPNRECDAAGCGVSEAIISNRLNFSLNLKGTSLTCNTACSASLIAIHAAKLHLKFKDHDPMKGAVGGGVQVAMHPFGFIGCCAGGMLSYIGRCFTFDKTADGYGRGEGVAFVFLQLQPLEDGVYGLLAGSQTNQDGRSASITAPNGPSQERCIKAALSEARKQPPEIDCFECHGTGTALGDPIEVGAFKRIYNSAPREHPLTVTTSKTNYGHSEGGAGVTGFLKCIFQVQRCENSPNLHLREFNGHVDTEGFPAQFITEGTTMKYATAYAGVSSFGFGGTNGHCVAYGKQQTTSRSTGAVVDFRKCVMDRMESAETQQISRPALDPELWESTGMPTSCSNKPKLFQVEINDDGETIWREVVPEPPGVIGKRFYLSGTFNDWGLTPMTEDPDMPGLFTASLSMVASGQELFQIVVDAVADLLIYPAEPMCASKTAAVRGPEVPEGVSDLRECSWCIAGDSGTTFSIQLYRTATTKIVTWLPI